MSAGRIAAAALACALALTLAPAPAGDPGSRVIGQAQAASCVPVQHSKRVVKRKKVRRHGKLVTVKRKKTVRWTTCAPAPPAPATCSVPSSDLGVTARDSTGSTFTLSRPCVTAGGVQVHFLNLGEDPHNLFLSPNGPGSEPVYRLPEDDPFELPPGPMSEVDATFELTAGEWYLWCELLTHEQQGMNANLIVS